jgi:predicted transcriptional regulator
VDERPDEPDLAARQAEIAAAMEETQRRQEDLQRRQDALLEQLKRLDRAMDRDAPDDG